MTQSPEEVGLKSDVVTKEKLLAVLKEVEDWLLYDEEVFFFFFFSCVCLFICLFVGWFVCWFVGLLVCWFVCWFVGLLVCWFVGLILRLFFFSCLLSHLLSSIHPP